MSISEKALASTTKDCAVGYVSTFKSHVSSIMLPIGFSGAEKKTGVVVTGHATPGVNHARPLWLRATPPFIRDANTLVFVV